MNFAWFHRTTRFAAVSLAVGAIGATVWTGCGSSSDTVCDDAGENCMVCDGYGCSPMPKNQIDAGADVSFVEPKKDSGSKPDTGKADSGKPDTGKPDTGIVRGPCGTATGGPCACTSSASCANGEQCVAGACEAPTAVCEYTSQCADGKTCADGQCVASCSASTPCAAGFTCTKGVCEPTPSSSVCTSNADCRSPSAPFCVSGSCVASCTADSQCATGDYCDDGACVLDTRPTPDCTTNSDCLSTQVCQGGYCLYSCGTSLDCEEIDARIPVCVDSVCRSSAEANPACTTQSDCTAGQDCISNVCE